MPLFSVIVCSHRAPRSIEATLRSIVTQKSCDTIDVVVVNNGFSDERARELQVMLARETVAECSLRIVREPSAGLAFARCRGMVEANGRYLMFLDDDNTIEPTCLATISRFLTANPYVGGVTPSIRPVWESAPPPLWMQNYGLACLSYNTVGPHVPFTAAVWSPEHAASAVRPPGGGMVIRRDVAEAYLDLCLTDAKLRPERAQGNLYGGQDADIYDLVAQIGLDLGYVHGAVVHHHIPKERLQLRYLLRLNYSNHRVHQRGWIPWRAVVRQACRDVLLSRGSPRRLLLYGVRNLARALGPARIAGESLRVHVTDLRATMRRSA